jgi:hypothetical protein
MIWRRLRISGSSSLAQFHHVIQIAMGWDDPNDVRIDAFEFGPGDRFIYTYNYVDNLVHDIRVESIVPLDESHWTPDCIGGNQLTARDSWPPPELPFERIYSIEDLTMNKLIERLTFINEQCRPSVFCRHAVNRQLVDAYLQSA